MSKPDMILDELCEVALGRLDNLLHDRQWHRGALRDVCCQHSLRDKAQNDHRHRLTQLYDVPIGIINAEDALAPGLFNDRMNERRASRSDLPAESVHLIGFKVELKVAL